MFEFKITGIVQGVGFRPFIYNKARKFSLKGFVQNTGNGVKIVCNNKEIILEILKKPPALAKIEKIEVNDYLGKEGFSSFTIKASEKNNSYSQIPADLDLCDDCVKELFEPTNKRYNYFFISCTNCGPRYSIIKSTPYDREKTSLKNFKMCKFCSSEYEDPTNRRYHAQTIACSKCGPQLTLYKNQKKVDSINPIKNVVSLLKKNEVVAIKGVGGFHLVCNILAVNKLKKVTKRYHKPFTLMAKDLNMINNYVKISQKEEEVLLSKQKPIILLEKIDRRNLIEVSELSSLGFMLPYTPLHYLLFENLSEPLIFTSSNLPSRPIITKKEEQFVDYVLDFNRDIVNFVDDSIIKVIDDKTMLIRRSRGFALNEITIPVKYQNNYFEILAVGGELKNTFCIKKKDKLILSQHIGNTYNLENLKNFKKVIFKLKKFTQSKFNLVLCDNNYLFNTSKFAFDYSLENKLELNKVQHHVAHGFSVAFEHNLTDFVSIVCDGTGFGNDGTVWGGEVFHNDKRIGHLENQTLVGGDIANKQPVRILVGILSKFMKEKDIVKNLNRFDSNEIKTFYKQNQMNFNCVESSSCGRILDCISVLLGFSDVNYYEGRGAMLLESNSTEKARMFFKPVIENNILMTTPLFEFIIENLNKIPKEDLARFSQIYIAKGLHEIAKSYSNELPIVFSGGCVYNSIMTLVMMKKGVLLNKEIPAGDGGLSAGQIAYFLWKSRNWKI